MNKKVIIALVIAIVAFFVFMNMGEKPVVEMETEVTANSLNQELDGLSDVDLNSELNGIDANVEKL